MIDRFDRYGRRLEDNEPDSEAYFVRVAEYRAEIERLQLERDTAWAELRGIREAAKADPEESTLDEVRAVIERKNAALREARYFIEWLGEWTPIEPGSPTKHEYRAALAAIDAALGNVREE